MPADTAAVDALRDIAGTLVKIHRALDEPMVRRDDPKLAVMIRCQHLHRSKPRAFWMARGSRCDDCGALTDLDPGGAVDG